MGVSVKRVYEPPEPRDGRRVLVDRLWPRGVAKDAAKVDLWLKDAAPSAALRKWFGHDPGKWREFQQKYRAELAGSAALSELLRLARETEVTLLYAAKEERYNNAVALREIVGEGV